MKQIGVVLSCTRESAVVEVQRSSACGENCAHCKGGCLPTHHHALVKNTAGAGVGDRVRVETPDRAVIKSAMIVYLIPLVITFVFYGLAQVIWNQETVSMCIGLLGLVFSFGALKRMDKRMAPVPEITQIICRGGGEADGT